MVSAQVVDCIKQAGLRSFSLRANGNQPLSLSHQKASCKVCETENYIAIKLDQSHENRRLGQNIGTFGAVNSSAFLSADRSPRKLIIIIIWRRKLLAQSIQKEFYLILKTEALINSKQINFRESSGWWRQLKLTLGLSPSLMFVYGVL